MERRDFLKYMLAMSTCMGCGCSSVADISRKNKQKKIASRAKDKQKWLMDHVGIPICYHCNLNCAYCNHYCPLVEKPEYISIEQFEKDVKRLSELTNKSLRELVLIGGEPLLHKDIEKLIKIAAKYFPETKKRIITNGILLKTMPETFWEACRECNITIKCSAYKNVKNCPTKQEIEEYRAKYNVEISSRIVVKNRFLKTNFTKIPKPGSENNYKNCVIGMICAQLDNGILYPCCVMSNIRFFNNYFKDYAIKLIESDYLDIHKISSFYEIKDYLIRNKNFCSYCNYGGESAVWKLSKRELSEWYDV